MSKRRHIQTHNIASFQNRLKQNVILDTLECYLSHLVSKVTSRVYLERTKLWKKEKSVNNIEGAITIRKSQIVKIKTPHLLTIGGWENVQEQPPSSFSTTSDTCVIQYLVALLIHMVQWRLHLSCSSMEVQGKYNRQWRKVLLLWFLMDFRRAPQKGKRRRTQIYLYALKEKKKRSFSPIWGHKNHYTKLFFLCGWKLILEHIISQYYWFLIS